MKRNLMRWLAVLLVVGLLAATGAIASDESITGTIEKTDQGIVISVIIQQLEGQSEVKSDPFEGSHLFRAPSGQKAAQFA